mgnify:CR=1 FL=1
MDSRLRGNDGLSSRKLVQIIDQGVHTLDRHRVIDRCPHTADGLVALQLQQPARFGAGQLCRFPAKRQVSAGERLCPAAELQLMSA